MAKRQRDYAAEYARRDKEAIKEQRAQTAREAGFASYGRYRGATEAIDKEVKGLIQRGVWTIPTPERASPVYRDLLKARAIVGGYSGKEVQKAAKERTSLLARTKEGRAVRDRLRAALSWKEGKGWGSFYFPVMRALVY